MLRRLTTTYMTASEAQTIVEAYFAYIRNKGFPCVGARAALADNNIRCMVFDHMACPKDDRLILQFLYDFVDEYRRTKKIFLSAAIVFKEPQVCDEEMFDRLMWQRLQALADLDAEKYAYDHRVDANPSSPNFSFSLKEEAFFIVGMHPSGNRKARQFKHPCLVFNPHAQFEELRKTNRYERMKEVVRKRDMALDGSVNPMLKDFGESSEVYQYSGRVYDDKWQCPLKLNHGKNKDNPSA
jgi:uncharacterized protein